MNEKIFQKEQWLYEEVLVTHLKAEDQDLDPVELYDCTIINAKLTGSTLKRWVFENCIFKDSDLSNVTFENCIFDQCNFVSCRMIGVDLTKNQSQSLQLSFKDCDLSLSNFSGLHLTEIQFTDSQCSETDFSHSQMSKCHFRNTRVNGAIFENTNLNSSHLVGALDESFDLKASNLSQATISVQTAIRLISAMGLKVEIDPAHSS